MFNANANAINPDFETLLSSKLGNRASIQGLSRPADGLFWSVWKSKVLRENQRRVCERKMEEKHLDWSAEANVRAKV